jgi:hypothetical protein
VIQGQLLVRATIVSSAAKRAVPADDRVGPAQRDLVASGLGGGHHGLASRPEVGPVPLIGQEPRLTGEQLPGMGDKARRGGLGGGLEQDLGLGLNPVLQLCLAGQPLGQRARYGRCGRDRPRDVGRDDGVQVVVQAALDRRPDRGLAEGPPGVLCGVPADQVVHHVPARPVRGGQAGTGQLGQRPPRLGAGNPGQAGRGRDGDVGSAVHPQQREHLSRLRAELAA